MPLTLVVGQKERFYIAIRHRGEYRKAIPQGMSVKISSRNCGIAVIHPDPEPMQDPAEGAPPTVASAMIEALRVSAADTTITAMLKLASGQPDAFTQDVVKVVKTGERSGTLFGSNVFIEAVNPTGPPDEGGAEPAPAPVEPVPAEPYQGLTAKQRKRRRHRGNQIDVVTEPAGEPAPASDEPTATVDESTE